MSEFEPKAGPEVVIVVAMARNRVIGRDGGMPWQLPSDLKRFKALTLGKPVIMGRKTWASIGRALPGRLNIVVTRDPDFKAEGATRVASLDEGLALAGRQAEASGAGEICVIGGGEIYRQAIGLADRLEVTIVEADIDGDTMFPAIDPSVFDVVADEAAMRGPKDSHDMRFRTYRRRAQ